MGVRGRTALVAAAAVVTGGVLAGTGAAIGVLDGPSGAEPAPPKNPVTVAFGGDVHFEGSLSARLASAPGTALGPIGATLKKADLAMVNLETAVTTGGTQAPKQFAFRAPPTAFQALKGAGVDVASMANNHGMDFGATGLRDSLNAAKAAKFPVVGIGTDAAEAYKPYTTEINGTRIAIIGATQVMDDNLIQVWTATGSKPGLASAKDAPRLVQEVKKARETADVVIVHLHWGQELNSCATGVQKTLAGQLADAGADAIVGGHAHVLQAGGYLKKSYVHYGMGNFAFYNHSGKTAQSGVLTLTFDPDADVAATKARWSPAVLRGGLPRLLDGPQARQALQQWRSLRSCANVTARPS